jgi:hypothetical protein
MTNVNCSGERDASSGFERSYDPSNTLREIAERGDHWLIGHPEGGLVEAYCRNDIGIAFRRAESRMCPEPKKWGVIIEALGVGQNFLNGIRPSGDPCGLDFRAHNDQTFMLAFDIELMEGIENRVPSFVWSESFDRGSLSLGEPLFAFYSRERVDHILNAPEDWEVSMGARFYAVACGESGGQKIEAAPDGIDNRANFSLDHRIKRQFLASDEAFIARIRIWLDDKFIWAAPLPGQEALLQNWDLGYGPINSCVGV